MPAKFSKPVNGTAPPVVDPGGEALAINIFDILDESRLDPFIRQCLLPPGTLDLSRYLRIDPDRVDEAAVRFVCPLLQAAAICDIARNNDRKLGQFPTRVYYRRAAAWERLPGAAVLTETEDGQVRLSAMFRAGRILAPAVAPSPRKITFGKRV